MRRNYSQINFNNRTPGSYVLRSRYGHGFPSQGELPRRSQRQESPFSDLGLFLLGCVVAYETIKQAERRIASA